MAAAKLALQRYLRIEDNWGHLRFARNEAKRNTSESRLWLPWNIGSALQGPARDADQRIHFQHRRGRVKLPGRVKPTCCFLGCKYWLWTTQEFAVLIQHLRPYGLLCRSSAQPMKFPLAGATYTVSFASCLQRVRKKTVWIWMRCLFHDSTPHISTSIMKSIDLAFQDIYPQYWFASVFMFISFLPSLPWFCIVDWG